MSAAYRPTGNTLDEMSNDQHLPSRTPSFLGMPRSSVGWWSVGLGFAFVVLFASWLIYVDWRRIPRPTMFSDPLHACLLIGAAASGIGGAAAGLSALAAKRERSILILLSILLGSLVLWVTIATLVGMNE